jgi:hypothetical protein
VRPRFWGAPAGATTAFDTRHRWCIHFVSRSVTCNIADIIILLYNANVKILIVLWSDSVRSIRNEYCSHDIQRCRSVFGLLWCSETVGNKEARKYSYTSDFRRLRQDALYKTQLTPYNHNI